RVDVELDVLPRVLAIQEQELRDDQVGNVVVDRRAEEDDALLQQQRVDVVRPLPTVAGLDNHRNDITNGEIVFFEVHGALLTGPTATARPPMRVINDTRASA